MKVWELLVKHRVLLIFPRMKKAHMVNRERTSTDLKALTVYLVSFFTLGKTKHELGPVQKIIHFFLLNENNLCAMLSRR